MGPDGLERALAPAGQVSTLAGQPGTRGSVDGAATTATFHWPVGLAVDASGILWVADTYNHILRKVLADHSVSTVAGYAGSAGNLDGTATTARFNQPCGVAVLPGGNLAVMDTGNRLLRQVTPAGVVTTYIAP